MFANVRDFDDVMSHPQRPALRWHWPLSTQAAAPQSDGYVEQIAFAVPVTDTDSDTIVHTSAVQPVWLRFINVSADGRLRYAHYVDTFEQYPLYCKNATGTDVSHYRRTLLLLALG